MRRVVWLHRFLSLERLSIKRAGIGFSVVVCHVQSSQTNDPTIFKQILAGRSPAVYVYAIGTVQVLDDHVTVCVIVVDAGVLIRYCIGIGHRLFDWQVHAMFASANY
jgi:hypothetical protein